MTGSSVISAGRRPAAWAMPCAPVTAAAPGCWTKTCGSANWSARASSAACSAPVTKACVTYAAEAGPGKTAPTSAAAMLASTNDLIVPSLPGSRPVVTPTGPTAQAPLGYFSWRKFLSFSSAFCCRRETCICETLRRLAISVCETLS